MFFYEAYGLFLQSNLAIPGLQRLSNFNQKVDLTINLKYPLEKIFQTPDWQNTIYNIEFEDGTTYLIDHQVSQIWANWRDDESLESATTYLTGPILGFVLSLQGKTCLHASAVAIDNKAIVFTGDSSAGKSTLAGIFAKRGFPVLSDDIVAITPQYSNFFIQPAYPWVRLWSNSVIALYNDVEALPRIAPQHPTWEKRYLDLNQLGLYQSKPLPLDRIYIIGERNNNYDAPKTELIASSEKMLNLLTNTYASYEFDKKMQVNDFLVLGKLAKQVTIKRLISHTNPKYLDKLCDVVLEDLKTNV